MATSAGSALAVPVAPGAVEILPSPGTGQVTLSWPAVPGATGYTVRRAPEPGGIATVVAANQPVTSCTDSSATTGVVQFYTVSAHDATGEGPAASTYAAPCVILDNGGTGTSSTGTWSTSTAAGAFGADARSAMSTTGTSPSATYTFLQELPQRGSYDVYLRWNDAPDRAADTPVWVYFDASSFDNSNAAGNWSASSEGAEILKATVDQTTPAGAWVRLGTAICNGLPRCTVVVRNNTALAGRTVVADAVQFVPRTASSSAFSVPVLVDEFSGTSLDTAKWSIWDGRTSVSVSGGELRLAVNHKGTLRTDGSGYYDETEHDETGQRNWVSGGIFGSKHAQGYGYYEVRFRTTQESGVDNAYWMLTHSSNAYDSIELDLPEVWETDPTIGGVSWGTIHGSGLGSWRMFAPTLGPGPSMRAWSKYSHPYDRTDWTRYHTYGIEWRTDNTVIYYVDGIERWRDPRLPDATPHLDAVSAFSPVYPLLTNLPMDWMKMRPASAPGVPPPLHGKTTTFDYLRIYQKPGWTGTVDGTWTNSANWGPDGVPTSRTAAVFNTATTATTVSIPAGQAARSLWLDTATVPALTFNGGPLKLGTGVPGVGGVMLTPQVNTSQIVNTPIEAQTNLQFANLSNNSAVTLTLNGSITSLPNAPTVFFKALKPIIVNQPILPPVGSLHKLSTGELRLNAASTFTGPVSLELGTIVVQSLGPGGAPSPLGASSAAPSNLVFRPIGSTSPVLSHRGPATSTDRGFTLAGYGVGTIEASGSGPLVWTGSGVLAPEDVRAAVSTTAPALPTRLSFTLGGTNTGANTFAGTVSDVGEPVPLYFEKSGSGTWTITGTIAAHATSLIRAGKLVVGQGTSGTFETDELKIVSGGELVFARSDDATFSGNIVPGVSNSGTVRKSGTGRLTFTGTASHYGATTIEAGTLDLAGAFVNAGSGASAVTIQTAATLTGSGSLAGAALVDGALQLCPLAIGGALSLRTDSRLMVPLTTNAAPGGPVTAGSATITSGARVVLTLNGAGSTTNLARTYWRAPRVFPLLTTSGALTGSPTLAPGTVDAAGNTIATYGSFTLQQTANALNLVWTPLPGFPVLDDPAVALDSPTAPLPALPSLDQALVLRASVSGGPTTTLAWSQVSGPGTTTFSAPSATQTDATFSAAGTYVLRVTATNSLGSAMREITVLAAPATTLALRAQSSPAYEQPSTFIRGDNTGWNSGARDQFLVGRTSAPFRALLGFPIPSPPSGATFESATLELFSIFAGSGTTLLPIDLHRLLGTFTEGTGDGDTTTNGAGTGADWLNRAPDTPWITPGGAAGTDYETVPLTSAPVANPSTMTTGVKMSFPTSSAFLQAVREASTSGTRLDLLLKATNDTAGETSYARLCSDENSTTSRRPLLTLGLGYAFVPTLATGSAPAAIAGVTTTLAGSATNATEASWSVVDGPGAVAFANANSATTEATFPLAGTYLLRLSAINSNGETARTLAVTVSPPPLEAWRQRWFGTPANSGPAADDADPDGDGLPNLLEFATGNAPTTAEATPCSLAHDTALRLTYTRAKEASGVTLAAEWTDDLAAVPSTWSTAGITLEVLSEDAVRQTLRATLPAPSSGPRFVRLRATAP